MNHDFTTGLFIGIASGVAIGGIVALLYAPKTGNETRQLIKAKAVEVVDTVKDKTTEVAGIVKDKATEVVDTVKEVTSEASRKGQAAVNAIKS